MRRSVDVKTSQLAALVGGDILREVLHSSHPVVVNIVSRALQHRGATIASPLLLCEALEGAAGQHLKQVKGDAA